jgi:DnaK suppressor protein
MSGERRKLTPEELAELRDRLLQRKAELWVEVRKDLLHTLGEEYQDQIQTVREEEDLAQADLQEEIVLGTLEPRKAELEAIADALWLMEKGEYGRCPDCGRWVRFKRLELMPWALRCTDCQRKREQIEQL